MIFLFTVICLKFQFNNSPESAIQFNLTLIEIMMIMTNPCYKLNSGRNGRFTLFFVFIVVDLWNFGLI